MNFVKSLAKQFARSGIRVNGVVPGPVWTPLQVSGGASPQKQKTFGSHTPLGRAGMPAELAGIYVQLADNQGSFATGQIYGASGGAGPPQPPASDSMSPASATSPPPSRYRIAPAPPAPPATIAPSCATPTPANVKSRVP